MPSDSGQVEDCREWREVTRQAVLASGRRGKRKPQCAPDSQTGEHRPAQETGSTSLRGAYLSQEVEVTTCSAYGPSGHASSGDPSHHASHRDSAGVPSGHASSDAPIGRPSHYRCLRYPPQEAGGSVPLE